MISNRKTSSTMWTKNAENQITIFLPFLNWSNQLQLPAISKRFDIEQRGWLRWITNSMQFYSFFLTFEIG